MVASSESVPPQLDEIAHIGFAVEASLRIGVPWLAAAKAALECRRPRTIQLKSGRRTTRCFVGIQKTW